MKFVVDIDDTLLYSYYNKEDGKYYLKGYNIDLITKINNLYRKGHEIILYTGRHWNHLELTKYQLNQCLVNYTTLIMGKPVGDYYIDDKAILPEDFLEVEI
jgi:hydroxymethylpyrimidine pyrophosphatase-like HAD family hydrolase